MEFRCNVIINLYSIIVLAILYYHSRTNGGRNSLQQKLYMLMIKMTALLLIVDVFSRFDGMPGTLYPVLNHTGNFLVFLLNPLLSSLWLLYAHLQVHQNEAETKRLVFPLVAVNLLHAIMVILSQFNGWLYFIDQNNIYHRGPLYLLSASITGVILLTTFAFIVANRTKIERKHFFSLVFFPVPPFVLIIVQILFYGTSLMLNGVVLSMLIVFLNIQNQSIYTDYLTGLYNRNKLDMYMKEKVKASAAGEGFSAILLDLDNFKSINDALGHEMGDKALETAAKLLKNCLQPNDFIARFGGDEFCIVLDSSNEEDLKEAVQRIDDCLKQYNRSNPHSYQIGFSMGYAVYDHRSRMKAEEFQSQIDLLMYENKRANKEICV